MNFRIALVPGDGIGPEIVSAAVTVLEAVGKKFGHAFSFDWLLAGGAAIDRFKVPLPDETLQKCLDSDSVLLGAVGGPKWDTLPGSLRPERALLGIRKELHLFANLRPARLSPMLKAACPLRQDIADKGFDLLIVRELTGGMYFGPRGREKDSAFDTEVYSREEVLRIGRVGFEAARKRRGQLTSVDKANVLESSRLWREVMNELAPKYPEVTLSHVLVDNAAMQLVKNPAQFDVMVTSNLFGDILSDEASQLTGSIGLLPSASLGEGPRGMYEPIHGSAPDIAGTGAANPIATILSAAMMLRMSFGLETEARAVEQAVDNALFAGLRTRDIAADGPYVGCGEMTHRITGEI